MSAKHLSSLVCLVSLGLISPTLHATQGALDVQFSGCTESVGITPVQYDKARALVPQRYELVTDVQGAKMVVRAAECQGIRVGKQPARPGRIAQVGLIIQSPDGTATDPNTSINNYTLSYSSDHPALVLALRSLGVPAAPSNHIRFEVSPTAADLNELYVAAVPDSGLSPIWFLHGAVKTPTVPSPFLANWWVLDGRQEIKMATHLPLIFFDFTSDVSFTTSRVNPLGQLLLSNHVARFPVSFRGAFEGGAMRVTRKP
jgi:hypothetical protein